MGRRLTSSMDSIMQNEKRYEGAIKDIIPTWQGLEGAGVEMCPHVLSSKEGAGSLKCRVLGFVEKLTPSFLGSMISGVVSSCPSPTVTTSSAQTQGCPTQSNSAGIEDLLGQNAAPIGRIIAGAAAILGCLGVGGAGAAMAGGNKGETDSEEGTESDSLNANE